LFLPSPVSYVNGDMNDLRSLFVWETDQGKHSFVGIKSGTLDQALIGSGEQQNGMDKYGDVEQMPAEWVMENAGGPDVAGSGNKVCVVYEAEDGNVKCSRSTCVGTYAPEFSWTVSTVEAGALAPAVWMSGDTVRCAYVKNGNVYLKVSSDAGATWGAAEQLNTENGKVLSTRGSVDVGKGGVAFADTRGGTAQIYYAPIAAAEPDAPTITGTASGDAKTAYEYTFVTVDGQGDQVTYTIDWGDGSAQETAGPAASGAPVKVSHTFAAAGDYTIKAKATDTGGHASDWGTLPVTMPVEIQTPFQLLMEKLFERFPHAFPILRHLLG